MKFEEALIEIKNTPTKYMAHATMVSDRHCYVKACGSYKALRLFNFMTELEQDWVPTPHDLLRLDWQVLEE